MLNSLIVYLFLLGLFPLWWALDERQPLLFVTADTPTRRLDGTETVMVRPGEVIEIRRQFCWRYRAHDVTIRRWLQDGSIIPLPPSTSLHNTLGCYDLWVPYTIPTYARGVLVVHAEVSIEGIQNFPPNPFRRVVVASPLVTLNVNASSSH